MFRFVVRILTALGCAGLCNFGIGSPRTMPPLLAVIRLVVAVLNPFGHGYAEKQGRVQTRNALARNICRTLGVVINSGQVLLLEGSKPGIRYVLQAFGLVGEVGLPMPFYPGNLDGVIGAGCKPRFIAMFSIQDFIQNLETLLVGGFRPVAVVLSFDNPRWLERGKVDYEQLVAFARQYDFILVSDEAYRDLAFDGKVWSLMQVEGWEQVGFVIQTASKPFSMAGDKLGAIIARQDRIISPDGQPGPLMTVKGRDSEGGSPADQKAWQVALGCTWYPRRLAQMYYRRARFTVALLCQLDGVVDVEVPFGGMFIYFGIIGMTSAEFVVAFQEFGFEVSPGERFGEPGRIRWCLNQPHWVTRRAVLVVARVLDPQILRQRLHTTSDFFKG